MHAPPTIIPILTPLFTAKLGVWKVTWHSRHNLSIGAFSKVGKLLPWG